MDVNIGPYNAVENMLANIHTKTRDWTGFLTVAYFDVFIVLLNNFIKDVLL